MEEVVFKSSNPEWVDGVMKGTITYSCTKCMGDGKLLSVMGSLDDDSMKLDIIKCSNCNGNGTITEDATLTQPKGGDS